MRKCISYIALLILFACTSDEMRIPEPYVPPLVSSDELLIHVLFPEMQQATKAITDTKESRIDSLLIFVFKDDNNTRITSKDNKFAGMIVVQNDLIVQSSSPDYVAKVTLKVKKPSAGSIRFVLVPNTPEVHKLRPKLDALVADVSKASDLMNLLRVSSAGWMKTDLDDSSCDPLPMWGTSSFYTAAELENPAIGPIYVNMTHALAKIEVGVDTNNPAGGDPAIGFGSVFKIDSVYLCNVNDSVRIAPPSTAAPDNEGLYSGIIGAKKAPIVRYKFEETSGRILTRTIYAPETDSLITAPNGSTVHEPPLLVLRAKYYDDAYYYYRVDFTDKGAYKPLLRNRSYTVNVTGIRTVGYKTLDEALAAPTLSLNPNLVIGEQEATINSLVYTGQYWLGCAGTDVKVDWKYPGTASINVRSSYPGGWKAELVSGSNWISSLTSAADHIAFNVAENPTGVARKGQIKLTAGTLTQYVNLTQSPGAHTYMAKAKDGNDNFDPFTIPLKSADMDGVPKSGQITQIRYYCYTGVKKEKEEFPLHSASGDYFTISADSLRKAVSAASPIILVTAYNASDEPVWAWTIWALHYGADFELPANQQSYNGYTFMKENLIGGQCYQWGRKDPAIDTTHVFVPPAVTLEEANKNPRAFYRSATPPYNYLDSQNNNLWTSIDGEKGPYDPCPFGWRVPPAENNEASPLNGFGNATNGMTITGNEYSGETGTASVSNSVWGASARGTDAYVYYAGNTTGVGAGHRKARRTNAYPIRCIRDVKRLGGSLIITK